MNNSEQAKNGFKTFLITFGVSLLIFGFFYYLLSDTSANEISIEDGESNTLGYTKTTEAAAETPKVDVTKELASAEVPVASDDTPFGKLSNQKVDAQPRVVLAGATQTTESTTPVPETGDFTITVALLTSLSLIGFFVYILVLNPRKYALSKFEEDVLNDL